MVHTDIYNHTLLSTKYEMIKILSVVVKLLGNYVALIE